MTVIDDAHHVDSEKGGSFCQTPGRTKNAHVHETIE